MQPSLAAFPPALNITSAIQCTVSAHLHESNHLAADDMIQQVQPIAGGSVSNAFVCITDKDNKIFVKICCMSPDKSIDDILDMFKSEAAGLKALHNTHTIRVPKPYTYGVLEGEGCGYLATEYIPMDSSNKYSDETQRRFGEQLADLHLAPGPDMFGFAVNNTVGSTPQDNTWTSDYLEFLRRRLMHQFNLAAPRYPQIQRLGQEILDNLPRYFEGLEEPIRPSLQHGDLWGGNWAADDQGNPVIYDPAAFYGHSESDLGIMMLFGDVRVPFYEAYHAKIPRAPGHDKRVWIYALYHAVNHLNVFGPRYLDRCISLLTRILGHYSVS